MATCKKILFKTHYETGNGKADSDQVVATVVIATKECVGTPTNAASTTAKDATAVNNCYCDEVEKILKKYVKAASTPIKNT